MLIYLCLTQLCNEEVNSRSLIFTIFCVAFFLFLFHKQQEVGKTLVNINAVWASGLPSAGCSTGAGKSNTHPENSTRRSPAGAGRAASVATATEGGRPRRQSPRERARAGRQTPEDEAVGLGYWQRSNLITGGLKCHTLRHNCSRYQLQMFCIICHRYIYWF